MLQITTNISELDYNAISSKVLDRSSDNKESGVRSMVKNLSGKAASAALKVLPQSTKDNLAVFLARNSDERILNKANGMLQARNIPLSVREISIVKEDNMKLVVGLDEVDYGKLVIVAYQRISGRFSDKERLSDLFAFLAKLDDRLENLIQTAAETFSQDEKDELSACVINTFEPEIISLINDFAEDSGIKLSVANIEVRKI